MKEKAGDVSSRRSWEEDMYWTHFRSIHFFRFLRGDFRQRVEIPKKFAENLGKSLTENVVLKGPSGSIWNVGLVLEDDELFFKRDWEGFVETYFLEENDILLFKYNGESSFDVLMFNYASLCEKEASYFQRKSERELVEEDEQLGSKKKHMVTTMEILHTPLASGSKHSSEEHDKEGDGSEAILFAVPILNGGADVSCRGRSRKETLFCKPVSKGTTPKDITTAATNGITDDVKRVQAAILSTNPTEDLYKMKTSLLRLIRPRRQSQAPASCPYLWNGLGSILKIKILASSFASKRRHGMPNTASLVVEPEDSRPSWKAFSLDNNLEEFDVCVFDLAESIDDTVVLDVTIFRVIEDLVPLTDEQ